MVRYQKEKKYYFLLVFFNLFWNGLFRQFLDTQCADKILLVQMDFGDDSASANLLASARYVVHCLTYTDYHILHREINMFNCKKLLGFHAGTHP